MNPLFTAGTVVALSNELIADYSTPTKVSRPAKDVHKCFTEPNSSHIVSGARPTEPQREHSGEGLPVAPRH